LWRGVELFLVGNPSVGTLIVGGLNTFSSLLINKAFGFNAAQSQLLSIPLGVMSIMYVPLQFA
jgi:hypothetical protein